MIFKPIEKLSQALRARSLRNSCCEFLTNHSEPIGIFSQLRWYFRYYRRAKDSGKYRVYLGYDRGRAIGYGALLLEAGELLVTECVGFEYRERGYGRLILEYLISIAAKEKRNLVAEIRSTNERSIALHEKAGFKLDSSNIKGGKQIRRYVLVANVAESKPEKPIERSRVVA